MIIYFLVLLKIQKVNLDILALFMELLKIDLIQMSRVGFLEVSGVRSLNTAFTDGKFVYFGAEDMLLESFSSSPNILEETNSSPNSSRLGIDKRKKRRRMGKIIVATMTDKFEVSTVLNLSGVPICSAIDTTKGVAYFGLDSCVVAKLKLSNFNIIEEISVNGKPSVLTLNADFLYIGFGDNESILRIDLNTNVQQEVELGIHPMIGLLDDNGNVIHYISNNGDLAILDLNAFKSGKKILEGDGEEPAWGTIIKNEGAYYFSDGPAIVKVLGISIFMTLFAEQ